MNISGKQNTTEGKEDEDEKKQKGKKKLAFRNRNYLLMDDKELANNGLSPFRISLASILRSKPYDIIMITLIVVYCLLIFLFFAFEGQNLEEVLKVFTNVELGILGIFVVEITLHLYAFRCLYLIDMWNIFDLLVIILSIAFVVLDLYVTNKIV